MALDVDAISQAMATAFFGSLRKSVPGIKTYAQEEAKKFAQSLAMIEALKVAGKIDKDEAALHLEIQKNATRTVFLTVKGLGILAVEEAINAALNAVKGAVNTALGFVLI
jgi:hypothetical protein